MRIYAAALTLTAAIAVSSLAHADTINFGQFGAPNTQLNSPLDGVTVS